MIALSSRYNIKAIGITRAISKVRIFIYHARFSPNRQYQVFLLMLTRRFYNLYQSTYFHPHLSIRYLQLVLIH